MTDLTLKMLETLIRMRKEDSGATVGGRDPYAEAAEALPVPVDEPELAFDKALEVMNAQCDYRKCDGEGGHCELGAFEP